MSSIKRFTFGTAGRPPISSGAANFFDTDRNRFVAVGGFTNAGPVFGDTWEYNPAANLWTLRQPIDALSGIVLTVGTYDPVTKKGYIFGGADDLIVLPDMLEYDGTVPRWKILTPIAPPATRALHVMSYDSDRKVHVLHGGIDEAFTTGLADIHEYDSSNNTWTLKTPDFTGIYDPTGPGALLSHFSAYDPVRKLTVITHGTDGSFTDVAVTWLWDGFGWRKQASQIFPSVLVQGGEMAFLPSIGKIVLAGTDQTALPEQPVQFWTLDENGWEEVFFPPGSKKPANRRGPRFTTDAKRGYLFSGSSTQTSFNDLWFFDGENLDEARVGIELIPSAQFSSPFDFEYEISNGLRAVGPTPFETTRVKVLAHQEFTTKQILAVDHVATIPVNTEIRYTLEIDSVEYLCAVTWVASDGSGDLDQTCDLATLKANITTAPVDATNGSEVRLFGWIKTDDTSVTAELDEFQFTVVEDNEPRRCNVIGLNFGVRKGTVVRAIYPSVGFVHGDHFIPDGAIFRTQVDKDGNFELSIPETETVSQLVTIEVLPIVRGNLETRTIANVTIPNQDEVDVNDLI